MSKLIINRGKQGASSVNGLDGLGVSDVQPEIVNSPVFDVLRTNEISRSGNIDFTRGSLASHVNRHHDLVWARNSSTTNFIFYSEDFSQWGGVFERWTEIGPTTDPFGGNNATEIVLDVDTDNLIGTGNVIEDFPSSTMTPGGHVTVSFWIKVISGTVTGLDIARGASLFTMPVPTSQYQRVQTTIANSATGFLFSISPRGLAGARFALYGVQIEDNHTATDYIKTIGDKKTVAFYYTERESDQGWLIEEEKENVVFYSEDLSESEWVKSNVSIDTFSGDDPFGVTDKNIRLVWASVPEITLTGVTGALTPSTDYTVSLWAYIAAGSLSELKVSLGGGDFVVLPAPSVIGFTRVSVDVISGAGTGIIISATSNNLTANLNIFGVQAELGNLTSYIKSGSDVKSRVADIVTSDIAFNIPRPSNPWSFIFRHKSVLNNSDKKFIFTNDQTGGNEFSCYFTNTDLTLKNGNSESTITGLLIERIAITFDGSTLKIHDNSTLILSTSITTTDHVAETLYIGMDSAGNNALNGHLSNFIFYDSALNTNNLIYLMGA